MKPDHGTTQLVDLDGLLELLNGSAITYSLDLAANRIHPPAQIMRAEQLPDLCT